MQKQQIAVNSDKIVQSGASGGENEINYEFFERSLRLFNDIFGHNLRKFGALVPKVEREFNKQIASKYNVLESFCRIIEFIKKTFNSTLRDLLLDNLRKKTSIASVK
ncbi:MAG: hypothetical protein LBD60_02780 [Puniceicoccales bacterium]|nr:hypothetical protein [Puniceicoccales bacterium]